MRATSRIVSNVTDRSLVSVCNRSITWQELLPIGYIKHCATSYITQQYDATISGDGECVAPAAVNGVYLITDGATGRHCVGKADGAGHLLARWRNYATTVHGGNLGLMRAAREVPEFASSMRWSVLRVLSPDALAAEVSAV